MLVYVFALITRKQMSRESIKRKVRVSQLLRSVLEGRHFWWYGRSKGMACIGPYHWSAREGVTPVITIMIKGVFHWRIPKDWMTFYLHMFGPLVLYPCDRGSLLVLALCAMTQEPLKVTIAASVSRGIKPDRTIDFPSCRLSSSDDQDKDWQSFKVLDNWPLHMEGSSRRPGAVPLYSGVCSFATCTISQILRINYDVDLLFHMAYMRKSRRFRCAVLDAKQILCEGNGCIGTYYARTW